MAKRTRRRRRKNPLTKRKARAMLKRGEYSSAKQRRFLGARASGQPVRRKRKNPSQRNPKRTRRAATGRVTYSIKRGGRVVGCVVASSRAAAEREASRSGYVLGMRRKMRRNPPRGAVLSERAESISYKHDADGEWYKHSWRPGVVMKVAPDLKSVTLYRPDGKPVAGNFWVPNRTR